MNILLLTSMYKIVGKETLKRDTEAVHNLVKYWISKEDVHLQVIDTYLRPGHSLFKLLKRNELNDYLNDYEYQVDGVDVYLTQIQQLPLMNSLGALQNRKILKAVQHVIKDKHFEPDLIIAHNPIRYMDMIWKINSKAPRVGVLHYTDVHFTKRNPAYVQLLSQNFDRIYARSASLKREARALGITNLSEFVVSSGVPTAEVEIDRNFDFSVRPVEVLYVGKLMKRKHLDYVVKSLANLNERVAFHLSVIGTGEELETVTQLTEACGLKDQVSFLGGMPREKVYEHMSRADVFIMPSVHETLGLVYLEAMMHGCITVGTRNEGIDGIIVDGRNGFLVEPERQDSVEQVLDKIFHMSLQELQNMSGEAVKTVLYHNEEDMSRYYLEEMINVVAMHRNAMEN